MSDRTLFQLLFIGCFVLVGGIFYLVGIFIRRADERLKRECTRTAAGIIKEIVPYQNAFRNVYAFQADGHEVLFASSFYSSRIQGYPGQPVTIHYDPSDTSRCWVEESRTSAILVKVFTWLGLGLIIFGAVVGYLVSMAMQG